VSAGVSATQSTSFQADDACNASMGWDLICP
jgi:hypothetical protein